MSLPFYGEIDEFNKRVIRENFNRVVCAELAKLIDPCPQDKTIVFCATDVHADMVVDLLKQAFAEQYGAVEDDTVRKVTSAAGKPIKGIWAFKKLRASRWANDRSRDRNRRRSRAAGGAGGVRAGRLHGRRLVLLR